AATRVLPLSAAFEGTSKVTVRYRVRLAGGSLDQDAINSANDRRRSVWARQAPKYEKSMGFYERRLFGTSHREWACSRATGDALEVAIGSGLNIPLYPADVHL